MKVQDIDAERITELILSATTSTKKLASAALTFSIAMQELSIKIEDMVAAHNSQQSQKCDTVTESATTEEVTV